MTAKTVPLNPKTPDLDWQNILWREWTWCDDDDYARRIYEAIYSGPLSWLTRWRVRRLARPYAHEIEAALYLACQVRGGGSICVGKAFRAAGGGQTKTHADQ